MKKVLGIFNKSICIFKEIYLKCLLPKNTNTKNEDFGKNDTCSSSLDLLQSKNSLTI